jgi:hypothetical protein
VVREASRMKVEIQYFDGCPTYRAAEKTMREVLAEEGVEAEVELVAVNSDEEARWLRFPGSPTIRVEDATCFPHRSVRTGGWGAGSTRRRRA